MKASDLFIKALENEGVEYVFGIPGEENLDFLEDDTDIFDKKRENEKAALEAER